VPAGYASLVRTVAQARSSSVSRAEKSRTLQVAITEYKKLIEAKYGLDEAGLLKKFQNDADFREGLLKYTNPYRRLYSEINFLASSLISDGVFDRCNAQFDPKWLREQELTKNILEQRSQYDASCEGAGYAGEISLLSRRKGDPGTKKELYAAYPLLFAGKNVADLLNLSDTIALDSSVREKISLLGKNFPPYVDRKNPKDDAVAKDAYLELKRTEELKGEIYDRAVVNSLKTKASIEYFFGGKTLSEVRADLTATIAGTCVACTPARRKTAIDRALNGALSEKKSDLLNHRQFKDPRNLAVTLCNHLIDAGYFKYYRKNVGADFKHGKLVFGKDGRDRLSEVIPDPLFSSKQAHAKFSTSALKLAPDFSTAGEAAKFQDRDGSGSSSGTGAAMDAELEYERYQKKRMAIYQSVVKEGSTNLLFLTDALSEKSESGEGTEYRPKLGCTPERMNSDAFLVEAAIREAKSKTDEVLADLNRTIKPADPNDPHATEKNREQIESMIEKNPTAVGEAVADRPDLSGLVCDGLNRNILADLEKKERHTELIWGVNIVGTALTLTGVGSGVGIEMLIAGGMVASSGTLSLIQNHDSAAAKELSELYRTQYQGGQSGNEHLLDLSEENVRAYQDLKVGVVDLFGIGVDSIGFIGSALKASMTIQGIDRLVNLARKSKAFRAVAKDKDPVSAIIDFSKTTEAARISEGLPLRKELSRRPKIKPDLTKLLVEEKKFAAFLAKEHPEDREKIIQALAEMTDPQKRALLGSLKKKWGKEEIHSYFWNILDGDPDIFSGSYYKTQLAVAAKSNANPDFFREKVDEIFERAQRIHRKSPWSMKAYADAKMGAKYRSTKLIEGKAATDEKLGVTKLTEDEIAKHEVTVTNGLLTDKEGHPISTRGDGYEKDGEFAARGEKRAGRAGAGIFVMDSEGRIFIADEHKVGHFHHSSLANGDSVAAAGEIEVQNGVITRVTDQSGHFEPPLAFTYQFLEELRSRGADLGTAQVHLKADF
jgi:hypothetical protein